MITVKLTLKEAQAVEAQLREIEESRDRFVEPLKIVRDHCDRLESARIRLSRSLQKAAAK